MHHKDYFESKSISWSVAVLCLSLILVYVVLYYAKWDLWKADIIGNNLENISWDIVISAIDDNNYVITNTWWSNELENNNSLDETVNTWSFIEGEWWVNIEESQDIQYIEDMLILSGTKTYYGELDFVDKLGISYKYALKDEKDIYYLNMWEYNYDFSDIVRKLKWSLYIINTDQELISNSLFGDKVTFINIPEYKNKKVLLLLELNNQSWLLAIDYSIYHQVKSYLKSLFIY